MTVLSPKPQEYSFLTAMDLTIWKGNDTIADDMVRSYHVVLCSSDEGKLAFPTSMLSMTMMSVIVWDDLPPDELSEDQKTALIDWLHWGGQLVINGPGSWSRLQNSFLVPYLPVTSAEAVELGTEELEPLNHWMVSDRSGAPMEKIVIEGAKIPGLTMSLSPGSQWLPSTDKLVAERSVGRGRVVMTSFPLREQRIYRWKYFSSFISTGLLRRPARTVRRSSLDNSLNQVWAEPYSGEERSPLFNSQLRIASRDMPLAVNSEEANEFAQQGAEEISRRARARNASTSFDDERPAFFRRFEKDAQESLQWAPNGAAWSDTSGFAFSALSSLRDAAGIVLPGRWTIVYLIGAYLAILVPLNWLFFRLIGRLELAWLVAPIIAMIGVVVVTRVARLNVGFARRTTEIGLLEMQGEYARAHLTNYTALYTSLSTNYALEYPERGSVALPLGNVVQRNRPVGNAAETMQARYGNSAGIRLDPVTVYSNSTELVHSEQMVPLTSGLMYGTKPEDPNYAAIKNGTGMKLLSCCLLRRDTAGKLQMAWIGDLTDSDTHEITFVNADLDFPWEYWNKSRITRKRSADEQAADVPRDSDSDTNALAVGGLLQELILSVPLVAGQVRLLGYTNERPGKLQSEPADGQLDSRCVVLAHLRPAKLGPVQPDREILGRFNFTPADDAADKSSDKASE